MANLIMGESPRFTKVRWLSSTRGEGDEFDVSGGKHARRFGTWLSLVTVVYINHWAVRVEDMGQHWEVGWDR
jgi:hypothetical protein